MRTILYPTKLVTRNLTSYPYTSIEKEVSRLFEDFTDNSTVSNNTVSNNTVPKSTVSELTLLPNLDIIENEKFYMINIEIPGVEESDINLTIKEGLLKLRAEKKLSGENSTDKFFRKERSFGVYERSISVADNLEVENITADFKNGVLSITLPRKIEETKIEKKIEIRTNH